MGTEINKQSEAIFLEYIQQNIVAKAFELSGAKVLASRAGMTPHSSGSIRRRIESHVLPNPDNPYFMRVDLGNGETY